MPDDELHWFEQIDDIDLEVENNVNEIDDMSNSIALKIMHETALKLKKLHQEFDQKKLKYKDKAINAKNTVKEKAIKTKNTVKEKAFQTKDTVKEKAQELKSKATGKKDEAKELFLKK